MEDPVPETQSQSTQYDTFAASYSNITDLPGEIITENLLRRGLGNVKGLHILDLACGSGHYTRMVAELGAKSVTGVDISGEMLRIGQSVQDDTESPKRIVYYRADCSRPLDHLGLTDESFDLVMANWLFNYSSNRAELVGMWRNVARYLRRGGRFVGVGELHELKHALTRSEWAGIRCTVAGEVGDATKVHTELLAEPKVEFDSFILKNGSWYRDVPVEVGMKDVTFVPPGIEDVPEDCRHINEWGKALVVPYCLLHTATRG